MSAYNEYMATPIEQIKQRLSILDVVGSYVVLQKAGKSFKGKSPFTQERTPSFFVSPERGQYYCFSTNKGGDIFTFIQEMEGVDFRGALKILAERAGVELTAVDPKEKDEREKLFALLEDATRFFEDTLSRHADVRTYLKERGLKDETIHKWRIGYAEEGWRVLRDALLKKGYTDALIEKAGLLKRSQEKDASYDVFRNRVMFPIADSSGRVVGFSGRTLSKDSATPKYVNSPETELYQKSHILFGYDKAKQGIRAYDFSLVVEGQFDLVLSHQAGYTNTVAISGTALTDAHIALLERLSHRIVLALDADKAGIASVKRSAALLLRRGMDVKVARIEGGKDPADLVREDPKLLRGIIGHAVHVVEFLLAILKRDAKDERHYRLLVREEVVPFVSLIPNRIDQEHFVGVVADALQVTKDAILYEVTRVEEQGAAQSAPSSRTPESVPTHVAPKKREEFLREYLTGLLWSLSTDESPVVSPQKLREYLEIVLNRGNMQALEELSPEEKNRLIFEAERAAMARKEDIEEQLRELHTLTLRARLTALREELRAAEQNGDRARSGEILTASNEVRKALGEVDSHNPFLFS